MRFFCTLPTFSPEVFLRRSERLLFKIHCGHRMDSEQLPTPESEESKTAHREADGSPSATNAQNIPPKEQASILYKVKWEDISNVERTQFFVSEVPLGPLEVTTKSFSGTKLVKSPPDSSPAVEIISTIEGSAPSTALLDDPTADSSDNSDTSTRSFRARNRRPTRTQAYRAPPPRSPPSDEEIIIRHVRPPPPRRRYAPVAFEDITITYVLRTRIIIHSEDLLEAIRGVVKYYPPFRLTGDSVEIMEPYAILVHHLEELEDLQGQLGKEFDALWYQIEV